MCNAATECLQRQSGSEWGFPAVSKEAGHRATDLTAISPELLRGVPTNNLVAERQLSRFDRLAARTSGSRSITHETLRNNMVLAEAEPQTLVECAGSIKAVLATMNSEWNSKQKEIKLDRIEAKRKEKNKQSERINKLLINCKSWSGPCSSQTELLSILTKHQGNEKKIVQTELAYYITTHACERASHPELFRQNQIPLEEKVENLCLLLSNEGSGTTGSLTEIDLPTLEDAISVLSDEIIQQEPFTLNDLCVNMWVEKGLTTWYIGYFKRQVNKSEFEVEQLLRKGEDNLNWLHPSKLLIERVDPDQLMYQDNGRLLTPIGQWDYGRNNTFCLKNVDAIKIQFDKIKHTFV